jgi:hypothetical protein
MTKEQLIKAISSHYDELKLWGKMGREVLEKNISVLSGDRRKKNSNRFRGDNGSQKPSL